jgi:hypothetical protein
MLRIRVVILGVSDVGTYPAEIHPSDCLSRIPPLLLQLLAKPYFPNSSRQFFLSKGQSVRLERDGDRSRKCLDKG